MKDRVFGILKSFSKGILKLSMVLFVLGVIYYGVDVAFQNILSTTARAVLSNFILFALIIALV